MRPSSALLFLGLFLPALGRPVRRNSTPNNAVNSLNSYSGAGGNAAGGSVLDGPGSGDPLDILRGGLVNVDSNNAGNAGNADSGPSAAGASGKGDFSGHGTNLVNSGSSFSGQGGQAQGGSVNTHTGLINIASNNAGTGGSAKSGSSGFKLPS